MKPATNALAGRSYRLERRVDLLQHAVLQHGDAVAHRHRLDLVVRDVDRRDAEAALQRRRSACGSARAAWRRGWTAARPCRNTCGSRTMARPIATRWRWPPDRAFGLRSRNSLQVEDLGGLLDPASISSLGVLAIFSAKPMLSRDGHVRVQRVVLEHHRDVAVLRRHVGDVALADADGAGRRRPPARRASAGWWTCRSRRGRRGRGTRRRRSRGRASRPPACRRRGTAGSPCRKRWSASLTEPLGPAGMCRPIRVKV